MRILALRWAPTISSTSAIVPLAIAAMVGCAAPPPVSPPDSMSAQDHRRAAAEYHDQAEQHAGQFDPGATAESPVSVGFPVVSNINADDPGPVQANPPTHYNPTRGHQNDARAEREHAQAHLRAAQELEAFTGAQCSGVSSEARERSPLVGKVSEVEPIAGGVRLLLTIDADPSTLFRAIQCHQAFARERHFEGSDHCPLYISSVTAVLEPGGKAIRLLAEEDTAVERLRARSRTLVAGRVESAR